MNKLKQDLIWRVLLATAAQARTDKELSDAEHIYRTVIEEAEELLGPENQYVASVLIDLAALYEQQGRLTEADSCHGRVREILKVDERPVTTGDEW